LTGHHKSSRYGDNFELGDQLPSLPDGSRIRACSISVLLDGSAPFPSPVIAISFNGSKFPAPSTAIQPPLLHLIHVV